MSTKTNTTRAHLWLSEVSANERRPCSAAPRGLSQYKYVVLPVYGSPCYRKDSHATGLSLTWESPYLGMTVFILRRDQVLNDCGDELPHGGSISRRAGFPCNKPGLLTQERESHFRDASKEQNNPCCSLSRVGLWHDSVIGWENYTH